MKQYLIILLVIFGLTLASYPMASNTIQNDSPTKNESVVVKGKVQSNVASNSQNVTVVVKGMVCSFCAQGIKKALDEHPYVDNVGVDLDASTIGIYTNQFLDDSTIESIIKNSGYNVERIQRQ
jgi:copper chaperone CopZ